jgi:Cys-tRNA(Pro)/Cys-tRNA(Cys) deacylase
MPKATRATRMLHDAGIRFTLHEYEYDPDAESVGLAAAAALGEPASCVLKTLMTRVDGKPACAILPSDCDLSMKKLARALGGTSAAMMSPADAERITGYKVGGISPFGQMKRVPVVLADAALAQQRVYVNAGQRGLQLRLAPQDIIEVLGAAAADLLA